MHHRHQIQRGATAFPTKVGTCVHPPKRAHGKIQQAHVQADTFEQGAPLLGVEPPLHAQSMRCVTSTGTCIESLAGPTAGQLQPHKALNPAVGWHTCLQVRLGVSRLCPAVSKRNQCMQRNTSPASTYAWLPSLTGLTQHAVCTAASNKVCRKPRKRYAKSMQVHCDADMSTPPCGWSGQLSLSLCWCS
jgi:hypothetical protein